MPQLMPLYWIMSTIMLLLFFMMMLKIYGNHSLMNIYMLDNKDEKSLMKWYW